MSYLSTKCVLPTMGVLGGLSGTSSLRSSAVSGEPKASSSRFVIELKNASEVPNFGELMFFADGDDNETASVSLVTWNNVPGAGTVGGIWVPTVILNIDLTFGTFVGVSGKIITNSNRFADTMVLTPGTVSMSGNDLFSPADNHIATAMVDLRGASKLEVVVTSASANVGSINYLFRGF